MTWWRRCAKVWLEGGGGIKFRHRFHRKTPPIHVSVLVDPYASQNVSVTFVLVADAEVAADGERLLLDLGLLFDRGLGLVLGRT